MLQQTLAVHKLTQTLLSSVTVIGQNVWLYNVRIMLIFTIMKLGIVLSAE